MEQMLSVLADRRRLEILEILREGEQPAGAVVERMSIAQSGVSRHLRILREAGLVSIRADGQQRLYALCPEPFEQLSVWIDRYRALWEHQLDSFEAVLKQRTGETDE